MIKTVRSPTRITPSTESLIDVIVTYKDTPILSTVVVDLGLSDHLAQIMELNMEKNGSKKNNCKKTVHVHYVEVGTNIQMSGVLG
jgi:hypothetical protein